MNNSKELLDSLRDLSKKIEGLAEEVSIELGKKETLEDNIKALKDNNNIIYRENSSLTKNIEEARCRINNAEIEILKLRSENPLDKIYTSIKDSFPEGFKLHPSWLKIDKYIREGIFVKSEL